MHSPAEHARLYLNDREVGEVVVRSSDNAWGFGEFAPNENFCSFAPIYGKWALLMHADEDEAQLSEAASEELRAAEYEMDAIRAKLLLHKSGEWRDLMQLNIDGKLIEWKRR